MAIDSGVESVTTGAGGIGSTSRLEEKLQSITNVAAPPKEFGAFTPSSIQEAAEVELGSAGALIGQGIDRGIVRFLFSDEVMNQSDIDRNIALAENFVDRNNVVTVAGASFLGELIGNAPTEIAVAMTGVGIGKWIVKLGKAANASNAVKRMATAVENIEDAYSFTPSSKFSLAQRVAIRNTTEIAAGGTAEMINQAVRSAAGENVTGDEVVENIMIGSAASVPFFEGLRGLGKGYDALLKPSITKAGSNFIKLAKSTGVSARVLAKKINESLDKGIDPVSENTIARALDDTDVDKPALSDRLDSANKRVERGLEEGIDAETPNAILRSADTTPDRVDVETGTAKPDTKVSEAAPSRQNFIDEGTAAPKKGFVGRLSDVVDSIKKVDKGEIMSFVDEIRSTIFRGSQEASQAFENIVVRVGDTGKDAARFTSDISKRLEGDIGAGEITVSPDVAEADIPRVVAHEITHAATVNKLTKDIADAIGSAEPDLIDDALADNQTLLDVLPEGTTRDLVELHEEIKGMEGFEEIGDAFEDNWRKDVKEFISEALTNQKFQEKLANTKRKGKLPSSAKSEKSLLKVIFDKVFDSLGLPREKRSVFDSVVRSTQQLIKEGARESKQARGASKKPKPKKKTAQEKASDAALAAQKDLQDDIVNTALDPQSGLSSGFGVARNVVTKKVAAWSETVGAKWSSDFRQMQSLFSSMGAVGEKLRSLQVTGIDRVSRIRQAMWPAKRYAEEVVRKNRADLEGKHKITLSTATQFDRREGTPNALDAGGQPLELEMSGYQLLSLYMRSMDGIKADGVTVVSEQSGLRGLSREGEGFQFNGNDYVLTPGSVASLQQGIGVSDGLKEVADALWDVYRDGAGPIDKVAIDIIGGPVLRPENNFYSPGRKVADDADHLFVVDDLHNRANGRKQGDKKAINQGRFLEERKGGNVFVLSNPVADMQAYVSQVPETIGMAEFSGAFNALVSNSKIQFILKDQYGEHLLNTLKNFQSILNGTFERKVDAKWERTLMSLRAVAVLGANISVAAKQMASAWSARATGLLNSDGISMVKQAAIYAKPFSKSRARVVSEMRKHSPFFADRHDTGHIDPDIADVLSTFDMTFDEAARKTPAELKKKFESKGIKVGQFYLKMIHGSMGLIRMMDEATMASIWQATKKTVAETIDKNDPGYWDEVNRLFTQVAIDSQPTSNPSTRSVNQSRKGLDARVFTQFSGQTAKNHGLTMNMFMRNAQDAHYGLSHYVSFLSDAAPILAQTAMVTATSVAYGATKESTKQFFSGDERYHRRKQKEAEGIFKKTYQTYVKTFAGQIPGINGIIADMSSSMFTGASVFPKEIPLIQEAIRTHKYAEREDYSKAALTAATFVGLPQAPFRLVGI